MRFRNIIAVLGNIFVMLGLFLGVPLILSLLHHDNAHGAFMFTIAITVGVGLLMQVRQPRRFNIQRWEAIIIVVIGWIGVSLIGALPFQLSGFFPSFLDAIFESVSGFTTTGASILNDVEALPISILVWRSMTHWLGGMGIIILALVVLPAINVGGRNLYTFESSALANEQITPKIKDTARLLWIVYFILTVAATALLLLCNLSFFDAALTAMATIATGGFSPRNASIAAYGNVWVEIIVVVFMFLSGINFTLYLQVFRSGGSLRGYSEVLKIYIGLMLVSAAVVVLSIQGGVYPDWRSALRYGIFQVVSINTTTGFVTADWEEWSAVTHMVLLILMLIGACPGSTTGAIKNSRIILLVKSIFREFLQMIHPRVVKVLRLNNRPIDERTIQNAVIYVGMYLCVWVVASLAISASGINLESAFFATATTLGGVGPGLGTLGPTESFVVLSPIAKIILIACMLLGRLEIYSILIVFTPKFWREV